MRTHYTHPVTRHPACGSEGTHTTDPDGVTCQRCSTSKVFPTSEIAEIVTAAQALVVRVERLPFTQYPAMLDALERSYAVIQHGEDDAAPRGFQERIGQLNDYYWIVMLHDLVRVLWDDNPAAGPVPARTLDQGAERYVNRPQEAAEE